MSKPSAERWSCRYAAGERGLIEMPAQDLVLDRQTFEAVGVDLHDRDVVDALEQVLALLRADRSLGRAFARSTASLRVSVGGDGFAFWQAAAINTAAAATA